MIREENIKILWGSINYFVDLFAYNIQDIESLLELSENKEKLVNELTNALLHNKCLISQLKRELDNIEFNLKEIWRTEDEM